MKPKYYFTYENSLGTKLHDFGQFNWEPETLEEAQALVDVWNEKGLSGRYRVVTEAGWTPPLPGLGDML